MPRPSHLTAGMLAGLALLAAGCGDDVEADPRAAVDDAVENTVRADGVEIAASMLGDAGTVTQLVDDGLDEGDAQTLLSSEIAVGVHDSGAFSFAVRLPDGDLVTVAAEDASEKIYLQLGVDALLEASDDLTDEDLTMAESIIGGLGGTVGFPTPALFDGEWIAVTNISEAGEAIGDLADGDDELAAALGFASGIPGAGGLSDADEREEAGETLTEFADGVLELADEFYAESIDVTYVGEEEDGERVRLTNTVGDGIAFFDEIETLAADIDDVATQGSALIDDPDIPEDLYDEEFHIDVIVDDGWLHAIEVDASQINDWTSVDPGELGDLEEIPTIGLRVELREFDGTIDAPSDAAEFDLLSAVESVEALLGGLGGGGADFELEGDDFVEEDDVFEDDAFEEDPAFPEPTDEEIAAGMHDLIADVGTVTDAPADSQDFWNAAQERYGDAVRFVMTLDGDAVTHVEATDMTGVEVCIHLDDAAGQPAADLTPDQLDVTVGTCTNP